MPFRSNVYAGVTLLELLVAMVIIAILLTLLTASFTDAKDDVMATTASAKARQEALSSEIDAEMGGWGAAMHSMRDPAFANNIRGLWLYNYSSINDQTLAEYDMIVVSGASLYRDHLNSLELVARYRRLRPDGWVITDERWDLMVGKWISGSSRRSPMPGPEEIGGWNSDWLSQPRSGWPTLGEAVQMLSSAGYSVRMTEFLDDKNYRPLIGTRSNFLPYFWKFKSDGTVELDRIKCRVSAPGYLAWRVAYAVRWQRILGADGIMVGLTKYYQYMDEDIATTLQSDWLASNLTSQGLSIPPPSRTELCPPDESFMQFSQAMFDLPLRPEFGFLPKFGDFSHSLARGWNLQHINKYRPGEVESYWNASLARAIRACQWWAVKHKHVSNDLDQGPFVSRQAEEAKGRGQMPMFWLERSDAMPSSSSALPMVGHVEFNHMRAF